MRSERNLSRGKSTRCNGNVHSRFFSFSFLPPLENDKFPRSSLIYSFASEHVRLLFEAEALEKLPPNFLLPDEEPIYNVGGPSSLIPV